MLNNEIFLTLNLNSIFDLDCIILELNSGLAVDCLILAQLLSELWFVTRP